MCAVTYSNVNLAKLLPKKRANVEGTDNNGRTPMMWAATIGSLELVELLLSYNSNIHVLNSRRRAALHFAAQNGHADVASLLLKSGTSPSTISDGGWRLYTTQHRMDMQL